MQVTPAAFDREVNSFYLCYEEFRASLVQSSFGTRQSKFQHVASHFFHDYEHLKDRCLNVKFIVNIGGPESHHRNWLGFFGLFLRTPCEVSTSLMILLLLSFIFILLLFFFPTKLSFCFKRNFQHGKQWSLIPRLRSLNSFDWWVKSLFWWHENRRALS